MGGLLLATGWIDGFVLDDAGIWAYSSVLSSAPFKMSGQISKKRKFVADGVFRAELNDFFTRELSEEGYSGCDVRVTHARTEVSSTTSFLLPAVAERILSL